MNFGFYWFYIQFRLAPLYCLFFGHKPRIWGKEQPPQEVGVFNWYAPVSPNIITYMHDEDKSLRFAFRACTRCRKGYWHTDW